jgi:hypothetical protein
VVFLIGGFAAVLVEVAAAFGLAGAVLVLVVWPAA